MSTNQSTLAVKGVKAGTKGQCLYWARLPKAAGTSVDEEQKTRQKQKVEEYESFLKRK